MNLSGVDLIDARLHSSVIIGCKYYNNMIFENAEFYGTIIDDDGLSRYLHDHNVKYVPPAAKDKKELQNKLEENGYTKEKIERIF